MDIVVNNNASYTEFLSYLPTLKYRYKRVLASFSLYEQKEKNTFIRGVKIQIYSLNYGRKKKDRIWEYLNDDIPYAVLEFIK